MRGNLETVVIGAGCAGLGISYLLKRRGLPHLILERSRIGETWRSQRWDSFRLNTPNNRSLLPGDSYDGTDPLGAQTHDEFIAYLENYAARNGLPIEIGHPVVKVTKEEEIFEVQTNRGAYGARNVVVATGNSNLPLRPKWSVDLPSTLWQIDASSYRNAAALPEGAVLVVGSGQSGGQIAEDLAIAGRSVFLATSRLGRLVRRYRGDDTFSWLIVSSFLNTPRRAIIAANGRRPVRALLGATHTISLQSLSSQGIVLLGRFQGYESGHFMFGDELEENIRFADEASADVKRFIDQYIERNKLGAPAAEDDPAETIPPRLPAEPIRSLDSALSGIATVIWCTGFDGNFNWIRIPGALDDSGEPIHEDGVSVVPGLYFAGLDFGSTRKSGTIEAIAEEGVRLVDQIESRVAGVER